jgi:glycosyltransferase involved in cell wall biosynthesis
MGRQPYFGDLISEHLKKTKSDIFLILLDTFMLMMPGGNLPYGWFLNIDCSPAQTIFWYPSDGGAGMPKDCERILRKVECPIAMSRFGQKQVKDYYNIDTKHIPHGLNIKQYFKLPEQERINLRNKWGINDKFVIGVVARNQPRKFLDRTMKAMCLIKDKIPNSVLFLHLDPLDPAQVFPIQDLVVRYGLENRVVFSGMSALQGIPENEMNNIYNLFDCFFLSTSGEGFGIPIIEAMAAEVPVVATSYTTTSELIEETNSGFGIKLSGTETTSMHDGQNMIEYDMKTMNGTLTGSWNVERAFCDVVDAAEKITLIANNPQLKEQMGKNGRKTVEEKYDFQKVGQEFEKVMLELLK